MTLQTSPTRLLSLGSIIADLRIDVPGLPPRGGDVLGSQASISAGGGFNILAAAARNGLKAVFGGRHGTAQVRMAMLSVWRSARKALGHSCR
jgi:sugar/nucleoside kinase (ribokinase family)